MVSHEIRKLCFYTRSDGLSVSTHPPYVVPSVINDYKNIINNQYMRCFIKKVLNDNRTWWLMRLPNAVFF